MRPGARLAAAIEILEAAQRDARPLDGLIDNYFKGRRYAGSKDRRAISSRVFDVIRATARLGWWLGRVKLAATPRARVLAHVALVDGVAGDGWDELLDGSGYCPQPLSSPERESLVALAGQSLDHADQPDDVRAECPAWIVPMLKEAFGDDWNSEIRALSRFAVPDLRVNTLKTTREQAMEVLLRDDIQAAPSPWSPWGLRLDKAARLTHKRAYRDGLVDIQDEGSQLITLLCDARPDMKVIDLCAGVGGKTLGLAAAMKNRGQIVAADVDHKRLGRMAERLGRAGVTCVETCVLTNADPVALGRLKGAADRVLVDAPCSGTGAWRRAPESRWRLTSEKVTRYAATQLQVLSRAVPYVAPGGRLIYATCSVLRTENESVVEAFMDRFPQFQLLDGAAVWADVVGRDCPVSGPLIRLSPATTQTDGFFVAVFQCVS